MAEKTPQHLEAVRQTADCLVTSDEVEAAIVRVAAALAASLENTSPLMLTVLNGGLVFSARLSQQLPFSVEMDYIHVSRYRQQTTGGDQLEWIAYPQTSLKGRCVVLVDDILDEGQTLDALINYCNEQGADKVISVVLADKQHQRKCAEHVKADFVALTIPDRYVFGTGMDYAGHFRNIDGIYAIADQYLDSNQ